MNMSKFQDVFDPKKYNERIHIIGCGSVGSCMVELLARYGFTQFDLWDFDIVEGKNIANQMFFEDQVGMAKTEAILQTLKRINADIERDAVLHNDGWQGEELDGYVFLCLDNIDVRRAICEKNQYNINLLAVFDVRTGLYDAQSYAADWYDTAQVKNLLRTMNFSHAEAKDETPVSACGDTLGVAATVRLAVTICVCNFMMFLQKDRAKKSIMVSTDLEIDGIVLAP